MEKEIESWLFWGRQEVGADRLKDAYGKGGAQLVDITDKIRTQRVLWLKRLWSMPEGAFPKVLANELIGSQRFGYKGIQSLEGLQAGLAIKCNGFYQEAINAWKKLSLKFYHGNRPINNYMLALNPRLGNGPISPYAVTRLKIYTIGDLRKVNTARLSQFMKRQISEYWRLLPKEVEGADNPDFVMEVEGGSSLRLDKAAFKDVYVKFRSLVRVNRHYETKWEEALDMPLQDEWSRVWESLHSSKASLRVRSGVWRQISLNFWTCYMDHAYIHRGDGFCEMCGVFARERTHTILLCPVVLELWHRMEPHLLKLDTTSISKKEMALGLTGSGAKVALRNKITYTLRSAVLAMRGISIRDIQRAADNIWGSFLTQLKREIMEDFWTAKIHGKISDFEQSALVEGVIGHLGDDGFVSWSEWLRDIRVGYWELFY